MARAFAKISFTPSVVSLQKQHGSDKAYSKFLLPDVLSGDRLSEAEASFIMERDSFYQASASQDGWPYVQYRGGPTGFLKIINSQTLAYADFRGNRQYISAGNISENDRVSLILVDYPNQRRLKIWGRAKLVTLADDPDLIASLHDETYRAKPERAVIIKVEAFDWNCPQHIHPRYTLEQLEPQITEMQTQIHALQEDNRALKAKLNSKSPTP
ncbi:MAG: pyridoxamine 5-phosphate oxidase [Robiginitomaculum sp.]|nr:MAG: pyridoxamine 5-phosphate oxidase [Robiginitomaculum sp.]